MAGAHQSAGGGRGTPAASRTGCPRVPAEQAQTILGYVFATCGYTALLSGDIPQALSLAHQALALLPEAEVIPRSSALVTTIRAYLVSGNVTPVTEREIAAAAAFIRTSDTLFSTVTSICLQARLYILQGRLRQAAATYEQVVQAVPRPEVLQTVFGSLYYYFGLGDLLREWNELEAAERHLAQGMAMIKETLTVEPFVAIRGYTALALLQQAHGTIPAALATLDALLRLAERRHFAPHLLPHAAAVQAQLELAQGNLAAAIHWADSSGLSTNDEDLRYPREGDYLALARVRIAQARDDPASHFFQDVLHLLDRLHRKKGQTLGDLCQGLDMTRQAVAKHLLILEEATLVSSKRQGREKLPATWVIEVDGIQFQLSSTDFGHLGIFPEQRDQWQRIAQDCTAFHARHGRADTYRDALHVLGRDVVRAPELERAVDDRMRAGAGRVGLDGHP